MTRKVTVKMTFEVVFPNDDDEKPGSGDIRDAVRKSMAEAADTLAHEFGLTADKVTPMPGMWNESPND